MFIDAVLDLAPGFGWLVDPTFEVRIVPQRNGYENRNDSSGRVRHRYILPFNNITNSSYLQKIKAAYLVTHSSLHPFKVRDHSDYIATAESLGPAPAGTTAVQLRKVSTFGPGTFSRIINKLAAGVQVFQDTGGGPVLKAGTVDLLTGLFIPTTAWTPGAALTWTGEFYVAVRFVSGALPMSIDNKSSGDFIMNGSVELIEVFGE